MVRLREVGWRRTTAAVVAGAALALGLVAAPAQSAPAQSATAPSAPAEQRGAADAAAAAVPAVERAVAAPTLTWRACRSGFECARVLVPRDHAVPDGPKVGLSVIRLPAADPARRIGALFLNPGGPGASGVDFVRSVAQTMPLELRARFDIVGFDPRGTMRSTALRCYVNQDVSFRDQPEIAFPLTARQETSWIAKNQRFAKVCRFNGGPVLWNMSTADVARDMDLLREAMGDEQLSYLGVSYGSMLGQTYANLFPGRSRAVVIDGVIDPVAWTSGGDQGETVPVGARLRSAEGARDTLAEFFRLCDAAGKRCAFSGGAKQRFDRLAARLNRKPIGDSDFQIGYPDLVAVTLTVLYEPTLYPTLAELMADLEQLDAAGARRTEARLLARLGLGRAKPTYFNVVEGFHGVTCADSTNPRSYDVWRQHAPVVARKQGRFARLWMWQEGPCGAWASTAGKSRYAGPWNAETLNPVLVVGNTYDPATPYSGAQAAAALLPGSRLLTYDGPGHGAFFQLNYCVTEKVTSYLVNTELPAEGTVCSPAGSPFGPLQARAKQSAELTAVKVTPNLPLPVRLHLESR